MSAVQPTHASADTDTDTVANTSAYPDANAATDTRANASSYTCSYTSTYPSPNTIAYEMQCRPETGCRSNHIRV